MIIKKRILPKILPEEEVVEEEEEDISKAGGKHSQGEKLDLHCTHCKRNGSHDASTCKLPWDRIEQERNQPKGKTNDEDKGKALESAHYVVAHCNIGVNKDLLMLHLLLGKIIGCLIQEQLAT